MGDLSCPLCSGNVSLRFQEHPGYVYGKKYEIRSCGDCCVSYVWPLYVEQKDYDAIYGDAEHTAGYDKYHAISRRILASERPLEVMKVLGDEYAYVVTRLQSLAKKGDQVLEVGCGLGYLTYALHVAGYDATGVDVSEISVNRATQTYGPYYKRIGLDDLSELDGKRFRFIVLTEVIEHVMEPVAFLNSLKRLLADDGMILLTTPNKSAFPPEALWMTDAPPIHLWWFSERSMSLLAERAGLRCNLFRGYVSDNPGYHYWNRTDDISKPMFVPAFDVEGRLMKNSEPFEFHDLDRSVLKHLYVKYLPDFLKAPLIRLQNMVVETRKTEKPCTMFVELKS